MRCDAARRSAEYHPGRINALFLVGFVMFGAVGYLAPRIHLNPDEISTPDYPAAGATALALAAAVAVDLLLLVAFALHDRALRRGTFHTGDPRRLIPPVARPFVWLVLLPSLTGLAVLASRVADRTGPLAVDRRVDEPLIYRFHSIAPEFRGLTQLGSPTGVAVLSVLLAVLCLVVGHRRAVLLALAGPPLAGALTEYVLKPLIGGRAGDLYAFPGGDGHTTGAVAVAAVTALFLLPAGAFTPLPRQLRRLLAVLAIVIASAVPLGLVVLRYHYATDVLAGASVAGATTLILALTLGTAARRLTRTPSGRPGRCPLSKSSSETSPLVTTAQRSSEEAAGRIPSRAGHPTPSSAPCPKPAP